MNVFKLVNDLHLNVGQTKRMNCPNCNGYKTFTVTNEMGNLIWNCYKASCNISGATKVGLTSSDMKMLLSHEYEKENTKDTFTLPEYVVPMSNHHHELRTWLDQWSIDPVDIYYDVRENRAVFPVLHNGAIVDATGRAIGNRLPKWKRYGNSQYPYTHGKGSVAVIVEDCVSAVCVSEVSDRFTGVSIMGTSLSEPYKKYLKRYNYVIIALDPDVLPKTISMSRELSAYVDHVKPLRLNDDLKYRNEDDIQKLEDIKWS
jgi:ribosomal protein L37AE/L43A